MLYVIQVCGQLANRIRMELVSSWFCSLAVGIPVWHTPFMCVQWKTPDDGQRNFPKHVEFHPENKFEKLVYLVGFIIRNLARCTVIWTSRRYTFSQLRSRTCIPSIFFENVHERAISQPWIDSLILRRNVCLLTVFFEFRQWWKFGQIQSLWLHLRYFVLLFRVVRSVLSECGDW